MTQAHQTADRQGDTMSMTYDIGIAVTTTETNRDTRLNYANAARVGGSKR